MSVTPLPPAPNRNMTPAVFVPTADAFVAALTQFGTDINTTAATINSNATAAQTSANSAATSAAIAQSSASAAAGSANATAWNAATNYTAGTVVWSLINYQTYRRTTNGVSGTDPSLDNVNWTSTNPLPPASATILNSTNYGGL